MLNYAYSLTNVTFRDYAIASVIGMVPGTVMYVYLGSLAARAAGGVESSNTVKTLWTIVGFVITIGVTMYVTRLARRALRDVEGDDR